MTMRVEQRGGARGPRGSLKWIQRAVNERPELLNETILPRLPGASSIEWLSPLREDGYAEYRDASFLERIREQGLIGPLREFWPDRGPQWDAIARSDKGHVLLIEAKAHIAEMLSPASSAGPASKHRIEQAFAHVIADLGAKPKAPWTDSFYQYANRLAHLWFLKQNGVSAKLVLVSFLHDLDMGGPTHPEAWNAATQVMDYVLGLSRHRLSGDVLHVTVDVAKLG
jgi:hypothetical protein